MITLFRIIVERVDGRQSKVMLDSTKSCTAAEALQRANEQIKPFEGGKSHLRGCQVRVHELDVFWRDPDTNESTYEPMVAIRATDHPWQFTRYAREMRGLTLAPE